MRLTYDRSVDAVYIYFNDLPYAWGEDLDADRRVDFGPDGRPRGVELLDVSDGVNLDGLPERAAIERLLAEHHIKVFAYRHSLLV